MKARQAEVKDMMRKNLFTEKSTVQGAPLKSFLVEERSAVLIW
jgi:hypothetical protein